MTTIGDYALSIHKNKQCGDLQTLAQKGGICYGDKIIGSIANVVFGSNEPYFELPNDLLYEFEDSNLALYYADSAKNESFIATIPHNDIDLFHLLVKFEDGYIYLGARSFILANPQLRCILSCRDTKSHWII